MHGIEGVVPGTAPAAFPAEQRESRFCLQYRQGRGEAAEADGAPLPSVSLLPLPPGEVPGGDAGCALGTYEGDEGEHPRHVLITSSVPCSAGVTDTCNRQTLSDCRGELGQTTSS